MRILVGVVAALVLALGAASIYLDRIVKPVVEQATTRALGLETTMGSMRVALGVGSIRISELVVANPPGFEGPHLLALREGHVSISLRTVLDDPIEVREITLEGVDLVLEQRGRHTNYGILLGNLRSAESAAAKSPPQDSEDAGGPGVLVRELVIRDTEAHVRVLSGFGRAERTFSVRVPEIHLRNLGGSSEGLPLAELVGIVTKAVLKSVAERTESLPVEVVRTLRDRLSRLEPVSVVRRVGKEGLKAVEKTKEEAEELLEGVRGLFRGGGKGE